MSDINESPPISDQPTFDDEGGIDHGDRIREVEDILDLIVLLSDKCVTLLNKLRHALDNEVAW